MSIIIEQRPASGLTDVADQLRDAFLRAREAIDASETVIIIAQAPDLLGQGTVEDAAVATGLLGLMRAITFEGASKGWQINMVAVDSGNEAPAEILAMAGQPGPLKGQVLNAGAGHMGKVIP